MSAWLHVLGSNGPEYEILLQDTCSFFSSKKRISKFWPGELTAEQRARHRRLLEYVDGATPEVKDDLQALLQLDASQVAIFDGAFCLTMINLIVVVVWKSCRPIQVQMSLSRMLAFNKVVQSRSNISK